jgi:DNA-binding MarR family transcriptional regulator
LITELVSQLRTSNAYSVMVSQAAADRIGINTTDLHALNILAFSDHELSAGELATTIGLTTASVTGVIDRLEHAGLVRRVRDPDDRRRVVVRIIPETARERVAPVFASLLAEWEAELGSYSERDLQLILEFQRRTLDIMRRQVTLLRGGGDLPG